MKTRILLVIFAFMATSLHAQRERSYSFWGSHPGNYGESETGAYYSIGPENLMQQRNGDFLIATNYITFFHDGHVEPIFLGNLFYKLSPSPLAITDSLFVAVTDTVWPPYNLFDRDTQGEGNIRATIRYDEEKDSTFLIISHFSDDSFYINHDEDILSPLGRGRLYDRESGYMIDCRGDLIMQYWSPGQDSVYMARFGLDGTLKHKAPIPSALQDVYNMDVFKESPLQYWQWRGVGEGNLAVYVMDSVFQLTNMSIFNKMVNEEFVGVDTIIGEDTLHYVMDVREYLCFDYKTCVVPIGEEVLVAAGYIHDTVLCHMAEKGVAVAKYDMRTMQRKALIVFNDYHGWTHDAHALGLKQMSDGTVYFVYRENGYPAQSLVVVKMDTDLNVEWKRWYKTGDFALTRFILSTLYEDGDKNGIAWVGGGLKGDVMYLTMFLLRHDGTDGVNENNAEAMARPYIFYPNPVNDQLRMEFSPDVQPTQVELYDLQGRLVRLQRNAFEQIDISSLSSGIYSMRITLTDGQVFSDKVVKE